ncbi:MAG: phage/plasmid primase, P4 family [Hyphomicrobium sp.]|uniref:phage/plasmid primase, P4 family n=1 Tax=Hyphomicrobium sp. TaxID=82 RepID=UPI003D10D267
MTSTADHVVRLLEAEAPEFSEEALALSFAEQHKDDLRYVAAWSRWHLWTGARWEHDETMRAFDHARAVCRTAAKRCNNAATAKTLASSKTVAAIVNLARVDRRIAAVTDQWDADPWLLNTPAGAIDLRAGAMRPHRREDHMTKITAVSPGGDCPLWRAFLHRVTDDDEALIDYLQRLVGYSLTGSTQEHAMAFLYGTGANGKSVFLSTIAGICGDYHRVAPIEVFTQSNQDRHPTELAMLRGARLVTAVETEEGRRWAEAKIKALTGGDRIAARFMRADFFEFIPAFKLIIAGNHKPGLRSVDEAIRRRLHLVPFTVTIPPEERDPALSDKLKAEWPGILAWMIEGCLAWQREGLSPPPAVTAATAAYLEAEDAIAIWIDECCERDPNAWTTSTALFASWRSWADKAGEFVGASKRFVQALETRGFHQHRRKTGRGFLGLRLRSTAESDQWWNP